MAKVKIFLLAHLSEDDVSAFLEHIRDFDLAHRSCYFDMAADAPELSPANLMDLMDIDPPLTPRPGLFKRKPE